MSKLEARDQRCCALILARGGSKSIPNKNVKLFNGVPLICHCLDVVTQCSSFDSIWVSTDCDNVRSVIRANFPDVQIHDRSQRTANDSSSSLAAIKEFCSHFSDFGTLALIQCTSPIIEVSYLQEAHQLIMSGHDSVFSVFEDKSLRWSLNDNSLVPINFSPESRPRRQDIAGQLTESGHFYFARKDLILNRDLLQSSDNGTVLILPPFMCIELDYEYQWPIAEQMAKYSKLKPV